MITFKQYLEEHVKPTKYFGAFNRLQIKILRALYLKYLKPKYERFKNYHITSADELIDMYIGELPLVYRELGDVLAREIPNTRISDHTEEEVGKWAYFLYSMIREKI